MKLLLDEHIDWRLKELFEPHEVFTIGDMEWLGKQNGELMTLIGEYEFDIFITIDKNIPYQQNLKNLKSALWVIDTPSSKRDYVALFIPMILEEIDNYNTLASMIQTMELDDNRLTSNWQSGLNLLVDHNRVESQMRARRFVNLNEGGYRTFVFQL